MTQLLDTNKAGQLKIQNGLSVFSHASFFFFLLSNPLLCRRILGSYHHFHIPGCQKPAMFYHSCSKRLFSEARAQYLLVWVLRKHWQHLVSHWTWTLLGFLGKKCAWLTSSTPTSIMWGSGYLVIYLVMPHRAVAPIVSKWWYIGILKSVVCLIHILDGIFCTCM